MSQGNYRLRNIVSSTNSLSQISLNDQYPRDSDNTSVGPKVPQRRQNKMGIAHSSEVHHSNIIPNKATPDIDEEYIKEKLSSNLPYRYETGASEIVDCGRFTKFTNALICGLQQFIIENEKRLQSEPDSLKWQTVALKQKHQIIQELLLEYHGLSRQCNGDSQVFTPIPRISTSHLQPTMGRFSSLISLLRPRRADSLSYWSKGLKGSRESLTRPGMYSNSPMSAATADTAIRMRLIERQVGNLSGAFEMEAIGVHGSAYKDSIRKMIVKVNLQTIKVDPLSDKRGEFSSRYSSWSSGLDSSLRDNAYQNRSQSTTEWSLDCCSISSAGSSVFTPGHAFYGNTDSEITDEWKLSNVQHVFSAEPYSCLAVAVFKHSKANDLPKKRYIDLLPLITYEPENLQLSLTNLPRPYVDVKVRWHPLTNLDLRELNLTKLNEDFLTMYGSTSLNPPKQLPFVHDRRRHASRDFGSSRNINDSNHLIGSSSSISSVVDVGIQKNFVYERQITLSEQSLESLECVDEACTSLGMKLKHVQSEVVTLIKAQSHYSKVLVELSKIIDQLFEHLSRSVENQNATESPSLLQNQMSPGVSEALSMLELSFFYHESPPPSRSPSPTLRSSLAPPITVPKRMSDRRKLPQMVVTEASPSGNHSELTSGWSELDKIIDWHLEHVSYMLKELTASEKISDTDSSYGGSMENLNNINNFPPSIRVDLIALSIQSQSDILCDLLGLLVAYMDSPDPTTIVFHANCLSYGGSKVNEEIVPASFWNLVWSQPSYSPTTENNDIIRSPFSRSHPQTPQLLLKRQDVQNYFVNHFNDPSTDSAENNALNSVVDSLMDQLLDTEISFDHWDSIPLTQLCHRLRVQKVHLDAESQTKTSQKSSLVGSRAAFSHPSALKGESSLSVAFKYLMQQYELQQQLRDQDPEELYNHLERLLAGFNAPQAQVQCVSISVNSLLCVMLSLRNNEPMVHNYAADLMRQTNNFDLSRYETEFRHSNLPFLRTSGPCYLFLKTLEKFAQNLCPSKAEYTVGHLYNVRHPNPNTSVSGYRRLTPTGLAVLWGMQSTDYEEYRIASLSATEIILLDGQEGKDSTSSASSTSSALMFSKKRLSRFGTAGSGHMQVKRDNAAVSIELKRMQLADSSTAVRSLALQIVVARRQSLGSLLPKFSKSSGCLNNS